MVRTTSSVSTSDATSAQTAGMTDASRGLLLGLLGVVMFAATGPLTKLAVGPLDAPQLSPWFVTFGRAAVAGGLSLIYLTLLALVGTGLVLAFMVLRSADSAGHLAVHQADVFLLVAMASAAVGYVSGARLTPSLGAERVICWALVISLPITLPMAWASAPADASAIRTSSWGAFAYLAVFSMWLGFFAWYRGLALGGAVRVSQTQLVQPFLSLLMAAPLLGEALNGITLGFGLAVIATVFVSKKLAVHPPPQPTIPRQNNDHKGL